MRDQDSSKNQLKTESRYLSEAQRIYAAQVKQLYQHIPIGIIGTLVNSIILVYVLWKVIDHSVLIIWLSAVVPVSLFRYLVLYAYRRSSTTSSEVNRWNFWFIFSIALAGIYLGSAAVFLFPAESIGHQAFIAFAQGGMVAGSVGTFSVLMYAFLAYSLPCLIPIIFRFLFIGGEIHLAMGIMIILFLGLMIIAARRINSEALSSLRLVFKNIDLVNNLTAEKETVEKLNENLKSEIVQRKRAAEDLKESEERYRDLFRNSPNLVYIHDLKGNFIETNMTWRTDYGYVNEDLIGNNIQELITDKYRHLFKDYLKEIMKSSKAEGYLNIVTNSGEERILEYVNRLINDSEGNPLYIQGNAKDITEQFLIQKAFRESQEKLTRAKNMEAVGLLAGGVAHDLNNILSGIVSYPEILLLDKNLEPNVRKGIMTIMKSGERAAAIVNDLLTIARGVASVKEPLNLNTIFKEYLVSPEYNKLMQYHSTVDIKTTFDQDLLNINASKIHIQKVVMNLVSNAAEALTEKGDTVVLSTNNRYLDKPLKGYDDIVAGEYAVLIVSDNGPGISKNDLERIFEPFYTKKVMGRSGTGLGLAVVWNTLQDHRGYINVMSSKNGTIFELYFPVTRDIMLDKELELSIDNYKGNGEMILVVDDIEEQRYIARSMLSILGYTVEDVSSGEEAVEYLKRHAVDLILLDMIMDPGINGCETYERIIKIHPGQKTVIASGFTETDEVKAAQRLGAGQYIKKPYALEKIGLAVKEELER